MRPDSRIRPREGSVGDSVHEEDAAQDIAPMKQPNKARLGKRPPVHEAELAELGAFGWEMAGVVAFSSGGRFLAASGFRSIRVGDGKSFQVVSP